MNKIVPGSWTRDGTFLHTMEGDDDMPGHVKSSMMGVSLNIPVSILNYQLVCATIDYVFLILIFHFPTYKLKIKNGRLALGTWQGIYLNEHRDQGGWGGGHTRNIVITLQGQS